VHSAVHRPLGAPEQIHQAVVPELPTKIANPGARGIREVELGLRRRVPLGQARAAGAESRSAGARPKPFKLPFECGLRKKTRPQQSVVGDRAMAGCCRQIGGHPTGERLTDLAGAGHMKKIKLKSPFGCSSRIGSHAKSGLCPPGAGLKSRRPLRRHGCPVEGESPFSVLAGASFGLTPPAGGPAKPPTISARIATSKRQAEGSLRQRRGCPSWPSDGERTQLGVPRTAK